MIVVQVIFVASIFLLTAVAQECPDPSTSIFGGVCVEACSSDSDCTNGQLCCSNGCGHECMTPVVDPCATVGCVAPNCSESSTGIITPEGQCCPVCACTATDGSMVAAGTNFMNDCNTCSCLDNGLAICTLIACVSTTELPNTTTDTTLLPTSSPMMCPNATGLIGSCDEQCSSDDECSNGQLCCSNGCGHDCMNPVPDCSSVTCLRPDCEQPGVLFTPTGSCCPICAIPDTAYTPETTEMPTDNPFHTCPTLESTDDNDCVTVDANECSSDGDCQYDRICCSNGCGGRVCSDPVELCQVVDCIWPEPTCEGGAQPEISPFRCCPFCPSEGGMIDDDGGTGVITMATLMIVTLCCFLTFLF